MTTQELNRDIKRLRKRFCSYQKLEGDEYYDAIKSLRPEFTRLFYADAEFKYMNRDSIITLLRINVKHRFVPIHLFGINIEF